MATSHGQGPWIFLANKVVTVVSELVLPRGKLCQKLILILILASVPLYDSGVR